MPMKSFPAHLVKDGNPRRLSALPRARASRSFFHAIAAKPTAIGGGSWRLAPLFRLLMLAVTVGVAGYAPLVSQGAYARDRIRAPQSPENIPPTILGARMRQHDWLACSLGSPGTWSQALRTMVRLLLNTRHPIYIFWGPDGACLYNDAYCQSIGSERHPTSLGRPAREVWGEIWDVIGPQIDQVMGGGGGTWHENQLVPITRHGRREDVYWTYSYSPIDDEAAPNGIGGVLVICNETTDAVQAQRLQTFWIKLNGAIHERSEPYEIMAAAASVLGSHLHAGRCGYGEVDERGLFFTVKRDWTDGAMASLAGRLRLADFGPELVDELKAGRTVRLDDPLTDMRTAGRTPAYASIGALRAGIAVPLRRDGRFVAAFYVHQTAPREWTDEEETLVREVAEYTWAAVERARAEDALRRLNATLEQHVAERTAQVQVSEARLRTIFETSYQYQGLLTPEGILVDANAISLQGIDSTLEDVVGQPFWETPWFTATPGMAETVRSAIPVVAGGDTVRLEAHVNLPVGGWRWFDITMRPISDASGAVTAIVPEAVELTQRRHAEEALRQAQKMEAIGQLTGGIAHDFNNMLTGVIGSLDLIQRRLDAGNTCGLDRYLNAASASAQRAAGLTHRLLAFARQQSLDSKPQDVNALIISLTELLRRTLGESVTLETVSRPDLWPALTDANQLESALVNLAINARDAMPDGGKLTITTSITHFDEAYALLDQEVQAGDYVQRLGSVGSGAVPGMEVCARSSLATK
jgi:PAS domain S-box-containing protein